jgi:chromosome segregation ATPase
MVEWVMFFCGGFLAAILFAVMLMSAVHHRAVRLTRRGLRDLIPLSLVELQAAKDGLRADFALSTQRLGADVERLKFKVATQLLEIGRKSEMIRRLRSELARTSALADERTAEAATLAHRNEEAEREHERQVAALTTRIEHHKSQVDRLMQHVEEIAHARFDEATAASALTKELEAGAARIAELEGSLAKRDRSLRQRDTEMKLLFRAIKTVKPDTVSRIQGGLRRIAGAAGRVGDGAEVVQISNGHADSLRGGPAHPARKAP